MIYITGDIHRDIDIGKLTSDKFPEGKNLTRNDYVIICGDFGMVWDDSPKDLYWRKWLENKPWTTLFVWGNHEAFPLYSKYETKEWHGGKVQYIMPHIIHLMRGQIYTIDGHTFFTMGGASSHDKEYRIPGLSWWPEELPSVKEINEAIKNLKKNEYKVDFIISHCTCDYIMNKICPWYVHDKLTRFFQFNIEEKATFRHWFFGHYHIDREIDTEHTALYNKIVKLEDYM